MTKDRARKRAARNRAGRTGERYVVARREIVEAVPARTRLHQGRSNPVHGEPRVLVGWQNRIAQFFGAK